MTMPLGLGPVFAVEWLTTSRRWQIYAGRSLFVAALLAGLMVVWFGSVPTRNLSVRGQALVGQSFFYAIVGTQLALVLLVAPAATAGAICLDKARGTLAHMLVTDLSDAEIVLGKFAARTIPVATFVCCTLPVMALTTLMGGIDPWALTGAFAITMGVGIFASAIALLLSVWGSKTHEVLMGTYTVFALWLLSGPMWHGLAEVFPGVAPPSWFDYVDPFHLAFAPQIHPGTSWLPAQLGYIGALLAVSGVAVVVAVCRVRAVAVRQMGQKAKDRKRSRMRDAIGVFRDACGSKLRAAGFRTLPSPSLDANPVLWREWHRKWPSRWLRVVWGLFVALSSVFSVLAVVSNVIRGPGGSGEFGALVVAFTVSIGLLLVAVSALTSLSEERVRGSLDVLMATPLSTRSIVWGKWWGAYRVVPWLAMWPVILTLAFAARLGSGFPVPLLLLGLILAQGALVTSLGLALATWMSRQGRALALSVAAHVCVTVGWVVVVMGVTSGNNKSMGLTMLSPFWGPGLLTVSVERNGFNSTDGVLLLEWALIWTLADFAVAALLLWATLSGFDRCLGRLSTDPTRRGPHYRWGAKRRPAVAVD